MLSSSIEGICLYLTSDKVKERNEALNQLQDLLKDKRVADGFPKAQCNRMMRSFFAMLAIEFKYMCKNENILPSSFTKMKRLLNDACSLLDAFSARRSSTILLDCIEEIFDTLLSLTKFPAIEALWPDIYHIFNSILADKKYLFACTVEGIKALHGSCIIIMDSFESQPAGLCNKVSNTAIYVAAYAFEMNDVYALKSLADSCLSCILAEESNTGDSIMSNLLRAFEITLNGLKDMFPILVRSLLRRFTFGIHQKGITRRMKLIEAVIRVFSAAASCAVFDSLLCEGASQFLLDDLVFTRIKLALCNPVELDEKRSLNEASLLYLQCLAAYCACPDPLLAGSKLGPSQHVAIFFSKCLFKSDAGQDMEAWAGTLSRCSLTDASWLLTAFTFVDMRDELSKNILYYAISSLAKPQQSEAASRFLKSNIVKYDLYYDTLNESVTYIDLTSSIMSLLSANFYSKHEEILWSSSAKSCFSKIISIMENSFNSITDARQMASKLHYMLPRISEFFSQLFVGSALDPSYSAMCLSFLETLGNIVESTDADALRNFWRMRWPNSDIENEHSVALYRLALTILCSHFSSQFVIDVALVVENLSTLHPKAFATEWLMDIIRPFMFDAGSLSNGHYELVITFCIESLDGDRRIGGREEFVDSNSVSLQKKEEILAAFKSLASVYDRLSLIETRSIEVEQIISDCGTFIFEQFLQHDLTIQEVIDICKLLPKNMPSELLEKRAEVLEHFFGVTDSFSLSQLCLLFSQTWPCHSKSKFTLKALEMMDSFDSGSVPFNARVNLVALGEIFGKRPSFTESQMQFQNLRDPDLNIDIASSKAIHVLQSSRSYMDIIFDLNEVLLPIDDHLEELKEVNSAFCDFFPSAEAIFRAQCLLESKSLVVSRSFFSGSIEPIFAEYFWFWRCCSNTFFESPVEVSSETVNPMFCPVVARTMLGHFDGHREVASKNIKSFKTALPLYAFENRFKAYFFRILAFTVLFYHQTKISENVYQQCFDHICSTLKLSGADFSTSIYGELVLLELMSICDEDRALLGLYVDSLRSLLSIVHIVHSPVYGVIKKSLDNNSDACSRQEIEQMLNARKRELKQPDVIDTVDISVGICMNLVSGLLSLPSSVCSEVVRVVVEVSNSGSAEKIPDFISFTRIPSGARFIPKRLEDEKICVGQEDIQDENVRLVKGLVEEIPELSCFKGLFHIPSIALSCAHWIFAATIMKNPAELARLCRTLPKTLMPALAEGIKIRQVISPWTDNDNFLMNWTSSSVTNLFLAEMLVEADKTVYCRIFKHLDDVDYQAFAKVLNGTIFVEKVVPIIDDRLIQSAEESLLLNQKWDITDLYESFDPRTEENKLYLQLRNQIVPDVTMINPPVPPFISLAVSGAEYMLKNDKTTNLTALAFKSFYENRKDPTNLFYIYKVIHACALKMNDCNLKVVAKLAEAKFLWKAKSPDRALHAMYDAFDYCKKGEKSQKDISAVVVLMVSKYAWKMKSRTATQIHREYLDGLDLTDVPLSLCSKAYHLAARFYDEHYQSQISSGLLQTRRKLIAESKKELMSLDALFEQSASRDVKAHEKNKMQIQQQITRDEIEAERILEEQANYGLKAAGNYLKAISSGDKYDLTVSRLCSLWFSFRQKPQMNEMFKQNVPAHKFIPLMYQLVARAESMEDDDMFQATLQNIIQKILHHHPYHCLYQLFAMRSSRGASAGSKRKLVCIPNAQDRRAQAASQIISKGKSTIPWLKDLLCDTEKLWTAYIEMALTQLSQDTSTKILHPFESTWLVKRIKDLCCPVLTKAIPVDPSGKYDRLVLITNFCHEGYRVVGGINLPKVVECRGSDGNVYKQLVKGRDDVRQDAVMEQVFVLVNKVLGESQETAKRKLSMRTFRVIPLQPLAGVIEWISGSIPIGDYLSSAHQRLCPEDISPRDARLTMKREFERPNSNPISKSKVFMEEVIARFQPVFRHFFTETTFTINQWYDSRLRYIKSVAVGSMIGYIVGLGDRHCQNIMVDQTSGELIHIDLNMIFEFGKTLRIPERVPFRLTRDLIDGMGRFGVEAGFTGNASNVMVVLRNKTDIVLEVLEAFKYDPLYHWSTSWVSTDENDEDTGNREADRALLRVKEKLIGLEEGTLLSERGQVSFLVQTATNEELLAQMYHGWQAWM